MTVEMRRPAAVSTDLRRLGQIIGASNEAQNLQKVSAYTRDPGPFMTDCLIW